MKLQKNIIILVTFAPFSFAMPFKRFPKWFARDESSGNKIIGHCMAVQCSTCMSRCLCVRVSVCTLWLFVRQLRFDATSYNITKISCNKTHYTVNIRVWMACARSIRTDKRMIVCTKLLIRWIYSANDQTLTDIKANNCCGFIGILRKMRWAEL